MKRKGSSFAKAYRKEKEIGQHRTDNENCTAANDRIHEHQLPELDDSFQRPPLMDHPLGFTGEQGRTAESVADS